jgi:F-type H+-transporting ATPase subunit epsilon
MAEEQIHIEVVTPERAVLSDQADSVILPGENGQLGVLPGHLPLLTSLSVGELRVVKGSSERSFVVEGGFAEILPNRVSILTEACDGVDEIDVSAAREAIKVAQAELEALEARSTDEEIEHDVMERHREALKRARTRLVLGGGESDG